MANPRNPTSSPYYWEKRGGLWVMRQKRFKKQRHTHDGEGHPHDIMAYAHSAKEAREVQEKYLGGKFGRKNPTLKVSATTVPAHVRINPRNGRIQVFVTPKVAEKLRGGKGLRVAGESNPLKQYKVYVPGYGNLGFVAAKAADAKRRALDEYSRQTGAKKLPRGTKVTVQH